MYIVDYLDSGELLINANFIPDVNLENIGDEYIFLIENIYNLKNITKLVYTAENILDTRTLSVYIRVSRDKYAWTPWTKVENDKDINCDFKISSRKKHFIEIKFVREGNKAEGFIIIKDLSLSALWDRIIIPDGGVAKLTEVGQSVFIKPNEVFKVFSLTDFQLVSTKLTSNRNVYIQYRISQDVGRTWTQWEELTTENISTVKFTPIRFFYIEYKLTRIGSDTDGYITIYGINLEGEFQNVSKDYKKTNLLGIRESCSSCPDILIDKGSCCTSCESKIVDTNLELNDNCELPDDYLAPMTDEQKVNLFKPYELNKAVDFYNKVANDTNEIFGHEVDYFITTPDNNAIDKTFHEYQLYNVVCENKIKISVNENQFPDNQITFNQFDLSLFESFEVHITKDTFKQAFGVEYRPSKEDFLFFCKLNRMYQVEHAQPYKDFNNSSVFYKVILRKYNKKQSVQAVNSTIEDRIANLTKNSTLDEFMGIEKREDMVNVAQKKEQATLSKDEIRYTFTAKINKELLENSSLVINKYNYDLSTVEYGKEAIRYKAVDKYIKHSDNRAYSAWFKVNNYAENEVYNFITNYEEDTNLGYLFELSNGNFNFMINSDSYTMPITNEIVDDTWYCICMNFDQRQRKISMYLYKRAVAIGEEHKAGRLLSSNLTLVKKIEKDISLAKFEFENDIDMIINASDMSLTNIRVYNDIVPEDTHNKVLNQYIVRDTKYLIMSDNSNFKINLPNGSPYN